MQILPITRPLKRRTLILSGSIVCFVLIVIGLIYFVVMPGITLARYTPLHYNGTPECLSYARTALGQELIGIKYLACKSSPATISNASIAIHRVQVYGGEQESDTKLQTLLCPGTNLFLEDNDPCSSNYQYVGFDGYVLGNGQTYADLDNSYWMQSTRNYCVEAMDTYPGHDQEVPAIKPSIQDLYLYQGKLYNRAVFHTVSAKTRFGTCVLDGTVLYADIGREPYGITNLRVTYAGFPADCNTAVKGLSIGEATACVDFVIAAHAAPYICETSQDFTYNTPDGNYTGDDSAITGIGVYDHGYTHFAYTGEISGYEGCVAVYEQRMAELNRCDEITNTDWHTRCTKMVDPANHDIRLVTGTL